MFERDYIIRVIKEMIRTRAMNFWKPMTIHGRKLSRDWKIWLNAAGISI